MVWFGNRSEGAGERSGAEDRVRFVQAFAVAVCGLRIPYRSRYRRWWMVWRGIRVRQRHSATGRLCHLRRGRGRGTRLYRLGIVGERPAGHHRRAAAQHGDERRGELQAWT